MKLLIDNWGEKNYLDLTKEQFNFFEWLYKESLFDVDICFKTLSEEDEEYNTKNFIKIS